MRFANWNAFGLFVYRQWFVGHIAVPAQFGFVIAFDTLYKARGCGCDKYMQLLDSQYPRKDYTF